MVGPVFSHEITLATTTPNTGTFNFDAANFPSVGAGSYFVLVEVSDGRNTNYRYSTGQLDVAPIAALANIPMYPPTIPTPTTTSSRPASPRRTSRLAAGYHDESTPLPFLVPNGASGGATPIFRMYNSNNVRHYYTANGGERDILMGIGWLYEKEEGFIYAGPGVSGTSELYRLYNHNSGVHLYTINAGEKDAILAMFPGNWVQHTSVGWAFP